MYKIELSSGPVRYSARMPRKIPARRRKLPPIVAAVVQPVAKRLLRIEALLIEMRHEQDFQLKRASDLQIQVETLTEYVKTVRPGRRPA